MSFPKEYFENDNRSIVNCTEGGKLNVFTRKKLEDFLKDDKKLEDTSTSRRDFLRLLASGSLAYDFLLDSRHGKVPRLILCEG